MILRPVGHITDLVSKLLRWAGARQNKQLDTRDLNTAIAYLEEYRELIRDYQTLRRRLLMEPNQQRYNYFGFRLRSDPDVPAGEAHFYDANGELTAIIKLRD